MGCVVATCSLACSFCDSDDEFSDSDDDLDDYDNGAGPNTRLSVHGDHGGSYAVDDTHNEDINGARSSSTVSVRNLDSGGSAGSFVFASEGDAGPAGIDVGSAALGGAGAFALMHGLPDLAPDSVDANRDPTAHCKTPKRCRVRGDCNCRAPRTAPVFLRNAYSKTGSCMRLS